MMQMTSTIDPNEIEYYERLATEWWNKQGKFWPLHRLNRLRIEYLRHMVCAHFGRDPNAKSPLAHLSVLDIGCGGGILSESMAKLGAHVTGIDVVAKGLQVAKLHSRSEGLDIDYHETSADALCASGKQFDVVLNMEVVEHVVELPTFLQSCARLTKRDGIMFVATINRNFLSWLIAIIGAEYILRWLPRGTHRWSKFVKPDELGELLAGSGMVTRAETGVRVNPINRRFSFTENLSVNYMLAATFGKP